MKRTIEKLRTRHRRHRPRSPSFRLWPYGVVTVNLILIALVLLDAPVGSYAAHTPNILKPVGRTITDLGSSGWIIIASLVIFFEALAVVRLSKTVRQRFQAIFVSHIAAYVFLSVAVSGLLSNLMKRAIGRPRPTYYDEWGLFGFAPFSGNSRFESFPSGHATTVGAFLMAMALLAPPYRLLFLIMGMWVALSRVIVGAHYPSDVIAGLAFGAWFSLFTAIMFARHGLLFRQRPDGMPELHRPIPLLIKPDRTKIQPPPRGRPSRST